MYKVIYLTGAPASGKSSLGRYLKETFHNDLLFFEYGAELTKYINGKNSKQFKQEDLRNQSSKIITSEDVQAVDELLITTVKENRSSRHIIIDTHAVTKEDYGYRVTSFSMIQLNQLLPTHLFVLYAGSETIIERIKNQNLGRPKVNELEANTHANLQATVAITYGILLGIPVYFFDNSNKNEGIFKQIAQRIIS